MAAALNYFVLIFIVSFSLSCTHKESIISQASSTAQPNVFLYKHLLNVPNLDRTRQLRIYLPPNYSNTDKRYPVLYMHDAQNLFDDTTAYSDEWRADETLNTLSKENKLEIIVVGIDNSPEKRMTELNAWDQPEFGRAEGKEYMEFIVNVVKPTIDREYRTLANRENTAIMGSSMGGLISHYAIIQHSDTFSKAGILSPAYWAANDIFSFIETHPLTTNSRVYFYNGEIEGGDSVSHVKKAYTSTLNPQVQAYIHITPDAKHNEIAWRNEFKNAVMWLFSDK
jgi:predicted alpha/beta superfamily hydrolase